MNRIPVVMVKVQRLLVESYRKEPWKRGYQDAGPKKRADFIRTSKFRHQMSQETCLPPFGLGAVGLPFNRYLSYPGLTISSIRYTLTRYPALPVIPDTRTHALTPTRLPPNPRPPLRHATPNHPPIP